MTVRLGRVMREMLETLLEFQSQPDGFSSMELESFAHKYRKALKEMRKARALQRNLQGTPSLHIALLNAPRGEQLEMTRPEAGAESTARSKWDGFFIDGPSVSEDFER